MERPNGIGLQDAVATQREVTARSTKTPMSSNEALNELNEFVDELLDKTPSVTAISMNVAEGENLQKDAWREFQSRLST